MEQPVARTPRPGMLTADEVAERLKIKKGSAYEVIRQMNREQEALGLADLEKIDGGTAQKLRLTLFPAGTVVFAKVECHA